MTCFSQISAYGKTLLGLAAQVGLDPSDNEETALRKRLAVVLCAGTLPLTVLWSAIYLAVGAPLAAAIPGFYSVFTPINTAIFARTHNLSIYRFLQLFLILVLPWLVTMSLGGFRPSSVVIMWAALCPIGALLLDELRRTLFWIVGFAGLLIATAILQPYLVPASEPTAAASRASSKNVRLSGKFSLISWYALSRRGVPSTMMRPSTMVSHNGSSLGKASPRQYRSIQSSNVPPLCVTQFASSRSRRTPASARLSSARNSGWKWLLGLPYESARSAL